MILTVNSSGERLDKYLSLNTEYSREYIKKMINEGFVLLNGRSAKCSAILNEDDEISVDESFKIKSDIVPKDIQFKILYEDDDLMVIDKPSGLVVHPGSGNTDNTLVNGLMMHNIKLSNIGDDDRPGIVHRIDKDTSGIMLVAKSNKCHELLADDFKNKRIKRTYIALVKGVFPHNTATIDAPIGRDKNNRLKMSVTDLNSKNAITHLKVLKRYKNYTLLSLNLETGRTHQIRVHMSYIGYPIHNDPVYTTKDATSFGQFLHSFSVDFIHPITKKHLYFETKLPDEFQKFIDTLEDN